MSARPANQESKSKEVLSDDGRAWATTRALPAQQMRNNSISWGSQMCHLSLLAVPDPSLLRALKDAKPKAIPTKDTTSQLSNNSLDIVCRPSLPAITKALADCRPPEGAARPRAPEIRGTLVVIVMLTIASRPG